ncbi:MFS transporter [Enterococcus avium]|uniref:MFS transporter n=1 Tax=Enterococcus avium TaxID=33945 RepID=UPI00159E6D25|nr:MFS transporter [Enterococcus avium]MBO1141501.1 MFS transporter [Enterococcus avium]MDT2478387.1 MFS transporter [Enterococcus avium]NVN77506.1 MFS transporter [Enterococcus avium]
MFIIKKQEQKILLIIVALFWFAQYVYIPYQTPYLAAINVSTSFIGVIVGSYGISQLALRLPVGILADLRPNHRLFISLGTLCAGVASLFRIFFQSGTGFLLGNVFSGFASATWISFMVYYLSLHDNQMQTAATGKIIMTNNIGMLIGFITSSLLYNHIGMTNICLLSVLGGFSGFVISLKLKKTDTNIEIAVNVKELLAVGKQPKLILFSFLALIQQGIQMSTTMSFTNQLLKEQGATDFQVGLSSITYMLSAVIFSRIGSGISLNYQRRKWLTFSSFGLLALYCFTVPLANVLPVFYLLQLIPGVGTGILFSLLTSEAMEGIELNKKSSAMGFFQAIYAIGMTLFPVIVGAINNALNLKIAYWVLSGISLVGGVVVLVYYTGQKKKENSL